MKLYKISFIDQTIAPNWYKDKTHLNSLALIGCGIRYIQQDAFNNKQFEQLSHFSLQTNPIVDIDGGAFNGLKHLISITFMETALNVNYKFLTPIAATITSIFISRLSGKTNVYNIIGSIEWPKIETISIFEQPIEIVTPNTITKVPNIEIIAISYCGIEVIVAKSFDHLLQSLGAITMRGNNLKTLPSTLFDHLNLYFNDIFFQDNPWECTCDFLKLRQKFNYNFDFVCTENEIIPICTNENADDLMALNKSQTKRKCQNLYGTNFLRVTYAAKFQLKIMWSDQKIYIKSSQRIKFHLIMFENMNSAGDHLYSNCIRTTAKYASVALLNKPFGVRVHMACAIDDHTLQGVWPLNCFSFTINKPNQMWIADNPKVYALAIVIVAFCTIFFVSIFLGTLLARKYLILMKGVGRVHICKNTKSRRISTVLVLPPHWKHSDTLRSIKYDEPYTISSNWRISSEKHSYVNYDDATYLEDLRTPSYEHICI